MKDEIGTLTIANQTGDFTLTWKRVKAYIQKHPEKHEEIKAIVKEPDDLIAARKTFEDNVAKGYDSYVLEKPGDISSGRKIKVFDPDAKFIVQMPKLSPGK